MNKNDMIHGKLPFHACVGQNNIRTGGQYKEPRNINVDTSKLRDEVASTGRFGGKGVGRGAGSTIPTGQVNVAKAVRLMKKLELSHRDVYRKTGLSNTAFDNAMLGKNVWITTIDKIGFALGLKEGELRK